MSKQVTKESSKASKANSKVSKTKEADAPKVRTFPNHTIIEALTVAEKIQSEKGGRPFNRVLLADALGFKPSSSNIRNLLSSSFKYGLTDGNEKSTDIGLTQLGTDASQSVDARKRLAAIRRAVLTPLVFKKFFEDYSPNKKMPSNVMLPKILTTDYKVAAIYAEDCARIILENGRSAGIIRDVGNAPYCMFDESDVGLGSQDEPEVPTPSGTTSDGAQTVSTSKNQTQDRTPLQDLPQATANPPRAIFIGHGKKRGPLDKLVKMLASFQIPHKVVVDEANLGRPIPQKVRDTMMQCGSAILIFTCDQKFTNDQGEEVWRPSENVVHELGAASYAYEDRVVIFKEKG